MRNLLVFLSIALAGCGGAMHVASSGSLGAERSQPAAQFPSRDQLDHIVASTPASTRPAAPTALWPDAWTLAGPFPDDDPRAPFAPATPLEAIGPEVAARMSGAPTISRAVTCGAREVARHLAAHPGAVDTRLAHFALTRCGSTAIRFFVESSQVTVPASTTDAALLATYAEPLRTMARERFTTLTQQGATHVGMHVERAPSGLVVAAFVGAIEDLDLTTRAPLVQGDGVVLRGRMRSAAQHVEAFVTFGPADFAHCAIAPDVALPEIAIRCPMHLDDRMARVEIMAFPPGRLLGHAVGRVLLRRDEATTMPALEVDPALATAGEPGALVEALMARANALRAQTGRAPLALELAQSATLQGLVPSWIAAHAGDQSDVADVIGLGVMAGWNVSGGTIRDARLGSAAVVATRHAGEWLALLVEDPWTRAVLLDPEMRGAAIGVRWDAEQQAFVGLLATYAFFEGTELERAREQVMRSLVAARAARGLAAPSFVGNIPGMQQASAAVQRGTRSPGQALEAVMNETASRAPGRRVQALLMEGLAPDQLAWPDELVARPSLRLGVGLAWHRVPGAAWGQYAVMVIVLD
ncbi:hypothetical protein [Sandaracinus amylolyticus]|uniref:hypothetical protein n=1 Tax=Sandaracinus amylolyticus TaxID=927083 RepID=UPI001F461C27|nr:hypothetical protein [Sandaracinus amylolyticus]UJR85027.1 Hypothetical protein I5071_71060 [Sandaracinus amylolyticus]